jgi:hypothetical protein
MTQLKISAQTKLLLLSLLGSRPQCYDRLFAAARGGTTVLQQQQQKKTNPQASLWDRAERAMYKNESHLP